MAERSVVTSAAPTAARVETFFDWLASRGHVPLLNLVTGTVQFDVGEKDHWWVTVRRGDVTVSRSPTKADCVLECDPETFARIISGEQNVIAAAIRGAVRVSGNIALGLCLQRVVSDDGP
jgi:SCP-2 sterol transfer family